MMSWWCALGVEVVVVLNGMSPGVAGVAVVDGWGAGCGFGLGGAAVGACALRAQRARCWQCVSAPVCAAIWRPMNWWWTPAELLRTQLLKWQK